MLPAPGDLVTGRYDNPVHYESRALTDLDDAVLGALGGSWSAPPVLDPGWERSPVALDVASGAPLAARRAFPRDGPVAWKDPRLCLLLPLWRSMLPSPVVTVLLWRDPMAVARSLRKRQGFSLSLGLALWERYNRAALSALAGHEVYVVRYEDLLDDPRASVTAVARWLDVRGRVPISVDDDTITAAATSVSRQPARGDGAGELPDAVRQAVVTLKSLAGANDHLPDMATAEPPSWMADVVAQRRDYEELYTRYMRYVKWRRKVPFLGRIGRRVGHGGEGREDPGAR
jgi:hypothetical protein